jgi:hypothetical protein
MICKIKQFENKKRSIKKYEPDIWLFEKFIVQIIPFGQKRSHSPREPKIKNRGVK